MYLVQPHREGDGFSLVSGHFDRQTDETRKRDDMASIDPIDSSHTSLHIKQFLTVRTNPKSESNCVAKRSTTLARTISSYPSCTVDGVA